MNESFYMHPRYDEFTAFLKMLNTDAKITPSTKHLAFDVWLDSQTQQFFDDNRPPLKEESNDILTDLINENTILRAKADVFLKSCKAYEESNETLKADLDRLHRERDSFQQQARVLAEEVERLNGLFLTGFNHAFGERGDACMAIDGGNL